MDLSPFVTEPIILSNPFIWLVKIFQVPYLGLFMILAHSACPTSCVLRKKDIIHPETSTTTWYDRSQQTSFELYVMRKFRSFLVVSLRGFVLFVALVTAKDQIICRLRGNCFKYTNRIETLRQKVNETTKTNQTLRITNAALRRKVKVEAHKNQQLCDLNLLLEQKLANSTSEQSKEYVRWNF